MAIYNLFFRAEILSEALKYEIQNKISIVVVQTRLDFVLTFAGPKFRVRLCKIKQKDKSTDLLNLWIVRNVAQCDKCVFIKYTDKFWLNYRQLLLNLEFYYKYN